MDAYPIFVVLTCAFLLVLAPEPLGAWVMNAFPSAVDEVLQ